MPLSIRTRLLACLCCRAKAALLAWSQGPLQTKGTSQSFVLRAKPGFCARAESRQSQFLPLSRAPPVLLPPATGWLFPGSPPGRWQRNNLGVLCCGVPTEPFEINRGPTCLLLFHLSVCKVLHRAHFDHQLPALQGSC